MLKEKSTSLVLKTLILAGIVVYAFLSSLRPLLSQGDTDIFWHIKQGEYIFEHGAIPKTDPFTYSPKDDLEREEQVLGRYWLGDVGLYLLYDRYGFEGLAILRSLVVAGIVLLLLMAAFRHQFGWALIFSMLALELVLQHSILKPNAFSELFAAAMLLLFLKLRAAPVVNWRGLAGIVALMALWANVHGAYVLGVLVLWAFVFGQGLEYWLQRTEKNIGDLKRTALIVALASGATLLNPFAMDIYSSVVDTVLTRHTNPEYSHFIISERSFMDYFNSMLIKGGGLGVIATLLIPTMLATWAALGLARKTLGLGGFLAVALVFAGALHSARAMSFLIILGGMIVYSQPSFWRHGGLEKTMKRWRPVGWLAVLLGVIGLTLQAAAAVSFADRPSPKKYPVELGEFLLAQPLLGNLMNDFDTGNFIMLELYPRYSPIIDSRQLSWAVFAETEHFLAGLKDAPGPGLEAIYRGNERALQSIEKELKDPQQAVFDADEYWYSIARKYGVKLVVTTATSVGFLRAGLVKLLYSPDWAFIYADGYNVVFADKTALEEAGVTNLTSLPKEVFFKQALGELSRTGGIQAAQSFAFLQRILKEMDVEVAQ